MEDIAENDISRIRTSVFQKKRPDEALDSNRVKTAHEARPPAATLAE